jgi:hypothetical protein
MARPRYVRRRDQGDRAPYGRSAWHYQSTREPLTDAVRPRATGALGYSTRVQRTDAVKHPRDRIAGLAPYGDEPARLARQDAGRPIVNRRPDMPMRSEGPWIAASC